MDAWRILFIWCYQTDMFATFSKLRKCMAGPAGINFVVRCLQGRKQFLTYLLWNSDKFYS